MEKGKKRGKLAPQETASRFLVTRKIHLPKVTVEQPKSGGHVTPNEDKYQKSAQLKLELKVLE